jgi:inner membrane transporter RhtA
LVLGQSATPLKLLAIGLVVAASVGTALGARRDARGMKGDEPPPFTGTIPIVPN